MLDNYNYLIVDIIYKVFCIEILILFKIIVYNILNLFVEKKLVYVIVIEENEIRYDLLIYIYGYFKCICCGVLFDVELNIDYSKS